MELYQLRAFVAVADEGNVTRAAERLFTSQPAVSGQIKALEQTLGVALFTRTPGGMLLTEAGRRLLHEAREALQRAQRVEDLAKHLRDGTAGTLRLGVNRPAALIRMEELTRHLVAEHPDLRLHVTVGSSGEITRALKSYDLDAGFAEGPLDAAFHRRWLGEAEACVILPPAWAEEAGGDWPRLQSRPWVFGTPDCSYCRLLDEVAREHGLSLSRQFRIDEDGTTLEFVRSGLAVSITDRRLAEPAAARGEVAIWPHFSAKLPHHAIALARRVSEKPIAAFFEACAAVYGQAEAAGGGKRLAAAG